MILGYLSRPCLIASIPHMQRHARGAIGVTLVIKHLCVVLGAGGEPDGGRSKPPAVVSV